LCYARFGQPEPKASNILPVHNLSTGLNYTTIQEAIDANETLDGQTILVDEGTYYEHIVVNKSLTLVGEDRDLTVINGQNNQFIISITANNVTIKGFTIQSTLTPVDGINISGSQRDLISHNAIKDSAYGIALTPSITSYSSNNTISGNTIENNQQGITLSSSIGNTISNNVITENSQSGIALTASSNNLFQENVILNNSGGGLYLYSSGGNVFSGNTFANNTERETISLYCYQNTFYHNNFYEAFQVDLSSPSNIWNFGGEGNYWSDYLTKYPNPTEVGNSGVWNIPYVIDTKNTDYYPLMASYVIPEFPSFLILPLFFITILLAVIVYERSRNLISAQQQKTNKEFKNE
jgi:parallel beta-helix repeat protein